MVLKKGDKVDEFSFTDHEGKSWDVPGDLGGERMALFFLRHLGCPICMDKLDEINKKADAFQQSGTKLFAVVQSTPKRCAQYAEKEGITFPLVPDREKNLYTMFDVRKGGLKEFTAPSAFVATVKATLKGRMHGKFEGDEFQVPAAFVLGSDGEVLWAHYGRDVADFGDVEKALAASG